MFNIYNAILAGGFLLFALLDALLPARAFPKLRWWKTRGLISAALGCGLRLVNNAG